ncbi:MFS transporter [Methylovirgula sp. 4M-Z18]
MINSSHRASAVRSGFVLFAMCLAAIAMPLTFTGPAVALGAIFRDLGGSPVALNWITNAFMLGFASALMAMGTLADRYGRKRAFLAGTGAFALASLGLAFAASIETFIALRAVQGIAAALAFASGLAALAQDLDGPHRMRAFSLVGTSFGIGLCCGPVSAGAMVNAIGWHSIFWLVVALTCAAFTTALMFMRESHDPEARTLDWPGALTFTGALSLLTWGVLQAPASGWSDPLVLALLAAAAVLAAWFVRIETHAARPMLDLSLFRFPRFVGVQLLAAAPAYAFVVLLVLMPIRFVGIEQIGEPLTGRMMFILSAPLLILPLAAGFLVRWIAPAFLCGIGLLICASGLYWLSRMPVGTQLDAFAGPLLTIGIGISLPWGLMDGLAVSVVPKERAGMAAGIFSTIRVAGECIALALVNALLGGVIAVRLPGGNASLAAQKLVTGNMAEGADLLAPMPAAEIVQHYGSAFSLLLDVLTGITILTAIVVFLSLNVRSDQRDETAIAIGAE